MKFFFKFLNGVSRGSFLNFLKNDKGTDITGLSKEIQKKLTHPVVKVDGQYVDIKNNQLQNIYVPITTKSEYKTDKILQQSVLLTERQYLSKKDLIIYPSNKEPDFINRSGFNSDNFNKFNKGLNNISNPFFIIDPNDKKDSLRTESLTKFNKGESDYFFNSSIKKEKIEKFFNKNDY